MADTSSLKFGRIPNGLRLTVHGSGTMHQSPAVFEFVTLALDDARQTMLIDLSTCEYLDSTFLGCLSALHRRFGQTNPRRFFVAAPGEIAARLFGSTRLDSMLNMTGVVPELTGDEVVLPPAAMNSPDLARHIMECHRQLTELDGPGQKAFAAIAEKLSRELDGQDPTGSDAGRSAL
jgi:anti-anti-sigma regulatory factor